MTVRGILRSGIAFTAGAAFGFGAIYKRAAHERVMVVPRSPDGKNYFFQVNDKNELSFPFGVRGKDEEINRTAFRAMRYATSSFSPLGTMKPLITGRITLVRGYTTGLHIGMVPMPNQEVLKAVYSGKIRDESTIAALMIDVATGLAVANKKPPSQT